MKGLPVIRIEASNGNVVLSSEDGVVEVRLGEDPPPSALPILGLGEGPHEIEVDRSSPAAMALGLFFPSPLLYLRLASDEISNQMYDERGEEAPRIPNAYRDGTGTTLSREET